MITEAEIIKIENNSNICTIRVPLFETNKNSQKTFLKATFSTIPGIYNNYLPGDKVFVAFENNLMDKPVILGKVYMGINEESKRSAGAIDCATLTPKNSIALPITGTTFVFPKNNNELVGDDTLLKKITSASDCQDLLTLINKIAQLEERISQLEKK